MGTLIRVELCCTRQMVPVNYLAGGGEPAARSLERFIGDGRDDDVALRYYCASHGRS